MHVKVVAGPMFSGKTNYLHEIYLKQSYEARVAQCVGFEDWVYYKVVSNLKSKKVPCFLEARGKSPIKGETFYIKPSYYFFNLPCRYVTILVDEAQFLDIEVVKKISKLYKNHINFVFAGLDLDFRGKPFPVVSYLLSIADEVEKLDARCEICGISARFSYRTGENKELVSENDEYIPLCRNCFYKKKEIMC